MHARRLIVLALAAVGCVAVAGCASDSKKQAKADEASRDSIAFSPTLPKGDAGKAGNGSAAHPSGEASHAEPQDPAFNQAAALARKTASYRDQLAPMITEKTNGAGPSTTPATTSRDGGGRWVDPNDLSLGAGSNSRASSQVPQRPEEPQLARAQLSPNKETNVPPSLVNGGVNPQIKGIGAGLDAKTDGASNTGATVNDAANDARMAAAHDVKSPIVGSAAPLNPVGAEGMFTRFDKRVKDYPRDVSAHLDYQLLRFLLDESVPDLGSIASLPNEDRELIAAVVDGMSNFRSALRRDNNMLLSRKVRPLLEMSDRLRSQADLTIPTISLCTAVRTFGDYDPIDPPRFEGGKAHDVILYCEVENFSSQVDDKQKWTTRITKEAVLYTENGLPVWSDKSEQLTDVSRHRRHDFFIVKRLKIPANLSAGRYLLKVSIIDQQVSRVAEATVPIVIVAAGG